MRLEYERGSRYYSLELDRDLFSWVVNKRFGGEKSIKGHIRHIPFEHYSEAVTYFIKEHTRRIGRGYVLTGSIS